MARCFETRYGAGTGYDTWFIGDAHEEVLRAIFGVETMEWLFDAANSLVAMPLIQTGLARCDEAAVAATDPLASQTDAVLTAIRTSGSRMSLRDHRRFLEGLTKTFIKYPDTLLTGVVEETV